MIAIRAGFAYFALIFALGFLLGTVRTLALEPMLGEGRAILLELPIMLFASHAAARWLVRRLAVPEALSSRLLMGSFALGLLLAAELLLGFLLNGLPLADALAAMGKPARLPGLLAQLLFGLMPAALLLRQTA